MGFPDIIAIAVIVLALGGAVFYIVKAKKSGRKCVGCPYACTCSKKGDSCSGAGEKQGADD